MTSVVRFEEWQEPTGTTAATVDGSGNVSFSGTITQGGVLMPSASDINQSKVTALYGSTTSCASGSSVALQYTTAGQVVTDVGNWHDTSTNPSRITVDQDGVYLVGGSCQMGYNSGAANFFFSIFRNGSVLTEVGITQGYYPAQSLSSVFTASAGQYFEFVINQSSGGAVSPWAGRNSFYVVLLRTI